MSFVQPSTVHAIAQSLEVSVVNDEAAKALAPDVEYRLREVVQVSTIAQGAGEPAGLSMRLDPLPCQESIMLPAGGTEVHAAFQKENADNR